MKRRSKTLASLAAILSVLPILIESVFAQIGGYDPSFSTGAITLNGAPASVIASAALSSGKILIAGDFTDVGGVQRNRIARLGYSGAVDSTFTPGTGANGPIRAMLVQTGGKILIGGDFTTYNGVVRNRIARLNSEGTLDTTFNPSTGANAPVHAIALHGSNILIGGEFTTFNGTARNRIARVTSTGTLDSSFNPSNGANDTVYALATENSNSFADIYVGGAFTQFGSQTRNRLVMLNSSGSVDSWFNRNSGFDGPVYALWANNDNYNDRGLYVGGDFTSYEGGIRSRVARFNLNSYDGKLDRGFNLWADGPVRSIAPYGTNWTYSSPYKILVVGDFTLINGVAKNRIARVEISRADYSGGAYANPELAFNPTPGPNGAVFSTAYFADGRVVIAGAFSQISGLETSSVARLYGDIGLNLPGTPSSPVATAVSESQIVLKWSGGAYSTSTQVERSLDGVSGWTGISPSGSPAADQGLITSTTYFYRSRGYNYNGYGPYSSVTSATTNSTAWTGPGVPDPTASPNSGANGSVYALAKQTDGKVIAVGDFSQINGITRSRIARLNTDWTVDATFDPGTGPNSGVKAAVVQPDGKILIVGDFSTVAGVSRKYVARLNGDGSLDTAFATSLFPDSSVRALALLPDGRIMIGGDFSIINGFSRDRLARLDANGVLDPTFSVALNSSVNCMESYPDGRVLIGGSFSTVQGVSKSGIARLNVDGLLDTSFNMGSGASDVRDLAFDTAGRIFLCGGLSSFSGVTRRYLAALDANGNLDSTFDPGAGPSSSVESIAIDGGGKILIGGDFETVAGVYRVRFARLDPTGGLDPTFQTGLGFNSTVRAIAFQNDGAQVAVGGGFSSFNGIQANYLTRLVAGTSASPFIVSATALPSGIVGVSYSVQLNAVGGVPPYTWSVVSGSPPSGIVLSADGSLHGISPLGGNETFGVRVTDSSSGIYEKNLNLLIRDIPAGLRILEATYGANSLSVNAEPYITAMIVNDSVTMSVSNSNFGGDPNFGVLKTLYVRYQDTSGHYETSVQEGGTLVLPNAANQRLPMDFTQWLSTRFASSDLLNPTISGPDADPENDGLSNFLEFAFGGNPKLNDADFIQPTFDIAGNRPRITFRCDSYRTTLTYTVESSPNLLSDSWAEIARSVGGGTTIPISGLSTVVDTGTGTRSVQVSLVNEVTPGSGFLRIKVQGQ